MRNPLTRVSKYYRETARCEKGLTSIILPSYNKPEYVMDAINSVLAQTSGDWELWIVENSTDGKTRDVIRQSKVLRDKRITYHEVDLTPEQRATLHPTAYLMNIYYRAVNGEYILFLADDDLLKPECVKTCASYMNEHPKQSVTYFSLEAFAVFGPDDDNPTKARGLEANRVRGFGDVDCRVDSGQIFHRKRCIAVLGSGPLFPEDSEAGIAKHADGLFMNKLVLAGFLFYPIPKVLATHRYTPVSTWAWIDPRVGRIKTVMTSGPVRYSSNSGEDVIIPHDQDFSFGFFHSVPADDIGET